VALPARNRFVPLQSDGKGARKSALFIGQFETFGRRSASEKTHTLLARSLALLLVLAAVVPAHAAGRHVVFVDNRVPPGGGGSQRQPFATIAEAMRAAADFDVIFVTETDQPYVASITLRRGQMLVGSAYGLDALRTELQTEFDVAAMPAAKGPGPLIQGSVILAGDNVVAGVTIETAVPAAIASSSPGGPISILSTFLKISGSALGLTIGNADFPVNVTGGGLTSAGGGGVSLYGGRGVVTFDRFTIDGTFTSALDIRGRTGATKFKGRAAIDVAGATQPAVTIANCTGRVEIEVPLRVIAKARGVSIAQSSAKISGDASRIATTDATALEIRDSNVEAAFANVSATGGDRGIVVDKLRGTLAITGGAIANSRFYGITISQTSGVRLSNITITDAGSGDRTKCDDAIEAKTNLRCGAGIHLRHVSRSEFENVIVSGGKQNGLNANNLEDVTFGGLQIRNAGDEAGEAAVVLDEAKGAVKFARCIFEDAAGGGVIVAQQFNSAKVSFDRCAFGGAARPMLSSHLATFRTSGAAKLEVEIRNAEMHDNAASAIRAEAAGTSAINATIADSRIDRFGKTAIEVFARGSARTALTLRGTTIVTPGNLDLPAVDVNAAAPATACADLIGNQIIVGGAAPSVRLSPGVAACH